MTLSAKKLTVAISVALLSAGVSGQAGAAGFALIENSASGMGNAFAGGSAIAEDASTVFFNPAGMMRLSGSQIAVAGHIISPTADFTDGGSTANPNLGGGALTGANDDGGKTAFVPNFYYVTDIGTDTMFGLGINVPFGLSTDYNDDWVGRYTATKSEVQTININPSIATKVTDKLSFGFGLNIQYIDATLENQLDSTAICTGIILQPIASPTPTDVANARATCAGAGLTALGDVTTDSSQSLSGDDWNTGYNFGFLYDLDDNSRLGFAYRSSIKHNLSGNVNFTINPGLQAVINGLPTSPYPLNTLFSDTGVNAGLDLPETISVSYYRDVNTKLAVMADITWTKWSNFNELSIAFDNPVQSTSTIPENWDNSWRYALGLNYKPDSTLTYRVGIALDQTPIPSAEYRTPRIPGNDRTWLSLGLGYNISTDMSIDVGYSHLFVDDTPINNTDASFGHTVTGSYDEEVDILSVQGNFKF